MIEKGGHTLETLEAWKVHAAPKKKSHWKDGRSAKESARAWIGALPEIPSELRDVLTNHPDFGAPESWWAEPEARVRFDEFGGEPANLDVLLVAEDGSGPFVVGIEAKADEPFSGTVKGTLAAAETRLGANPRSKGVARLEKLLRAILGVGIEELESVEGLRYQLLTATAAVLAEAERRGASRAALVVHEFVTDETTDENHARNAADCKAFLQLLTEDVPTSPALEKLIGPIKIPGDPLLHSPVRLYLGKTPRNLRG